jgi:L-aminopeptidase/D-esterase-like protein
MNRREFSHNVLAALQGMTLSGLSRAYGTTRGPSSISLEEPDRSIQGGLTDVEGIKVGHFTEKRRPTGCTVVLCEKGAVAGVDVRGGAPGTRETDLLNPINTVQQVYAIVLSGGSAFGLDTASGVMRFLDERGIGFRFGPQVIPIVPAAILFDLTIGDGKIRPTGESGYQACLAASSDKVLEGNVGVGAGATVGKLFGPQFAMKGGLGTASIRVADTGLVIAAVVVVNAVGDVYQPATGKILAGARGPNGERFANTMSKILSGYAAVPSADGHAPSNSTIGVVATNASLNKDEATKVAQMAQDGLARAINPVHTPQDGDVIFALATGTFKPAVSVGAVGAIAAVVTAQAIVRAVTQAESILGIPSYRDLQDKAR